MPASQVVKGGPYRGDLAAGGQLIGDLGGVNLFLTLLVLDDVLDTFNAIGTVISITV